MVPLLAIAAWSGTGKTTLLKQLIPLLKARGIRPGLIKHTHHPMDIDKPGKDSYELRKAGADQVLVASHHRWALMTETPHNNRVDLTFLVTRMDASLLDIVLIEGFKDEPVPKIVLWRSDCGHSLETLPDSGVIAIASDQPVSVSLPVLDINNPGEIAQFIAAWLELQQS